MRLEPVLCPHGQVTSWKVTGADTGVALPPVEHCEECANAAKEAKP